MALLQLHFGGFARSSNFEVKKTAVEVETAQQEDEGLRSRLPRFIILYALSEYTLPDKSIVRINTGELIC
jgi:hypothetical protein